MKAAFLTPSEEEQILQAIALAESRTSGEIRVHIESRCKAEPVARAVELFYLLKMDTTAERNGVLIYVATNDHKLAIIGDSGINEVVPPNFWDKARDLMAISFKSLKFAEGIVGAISLAGEQLGSWFPFKDGDSNELSNDISLGE